MALACVGHGLHEWRRKPLPWRGFGILSLARRLEVIADDLEMCRNQALALRIEDYWGLQASSWELPVPVIFSYFSPHGLGQNR
jgi:hypothetical protein